MTDFFKNWLKFRNKDSVFYLLMAVVISICFKTAIGLYLTFHGYGFSIVSPPSSFLFASLDIMIAIGVFFLIDKIPARIFRISIYHSIIILSIVFLYCNYLIYEYFHTFLNWGLICFNGAGSTELASYVVNSYGGNLLLLTFFSVVYVLISTKNKMLQLFYNYQSVFLILLIFNIVIFIFLSQFGRAETGRMIRNPVIEFAKSIVNEFVFIDNDISIENFSVPEHPILGNGPFHESFSQIRSHNEIKNVLVIMIESLPLEMTPLGNSDENSFAIINKIKNSSIAFTSYRTIFPGTSRSFIAANCGSLPGTAHETITNYMADFRCSPLAETFNNAGYETGFFGSSLFTYDNLSSGVFAKKYKVFKDFNSLKNKYSSDNKLYSYQVKDEDTLNETFEFMSETAKKDRSFFAYTFLYSTHYPYSSPLSTNEKPGSIESYRKTLSYLSIELEKLLNRMNSAGFLKNTAVIITADHGEAFGKRKGVYGHGHSLYDEAIKIPLLIYLPGMEKGIVSKRNGTHVDLAPTIGFIAGLKPGINWQGVNLLDENFISRPMLIFTRSSTRLNGIVDGNYKYIYDVTEKTELLFDLDADPDELKNLAIEKPDESGNYRNLIEKWITYQQKWITNRAL